MRIPQNTARRIRRVALIAGGGAVTSALCVGTLGVGTAFADDDHGHSADSDSDSSWNAGTPVTAFADHWEEYHKGKDPVTNEPKAITSDPGYYGEIHEEMVQNMLPK